MVLGTLTYNEIFQVSLFGLNMDIKEENRRGYDEEEEGER